LHSGAHGLKNVQRMICRSKTRSSQTELAPGNAGSDPLRRRVPQELAASQRVGALLGCAL
jgi:hypothetical protein